MLQHVVHGATKGLQEVIKDKQMCYNFLFSDHI
jgi:hypothetical protein